MSRKIDALRWLAGFPVSERVGQVLTRASDYACRRHHEYIGTEHLLAGLVAEKDGVAAAVLQHLQIDSDKVIDRLNAAVKMGSTDRGPGAVLPYTSRAKKALELAREEARSLWHGYLGTEHLLIGLLAEKNGVGAQVLGEFGASVDVVRTETQRILGPSPGGA